MITINDIALVRATNIIPFDGKIIPISEARYIKKDMYGELSHVLGDIIKKQKNYNLWNEEEYEVYKKELWELLPYSSDYNSMVLFSLNGIVPDDINNTFSNKNCAIIDDLSSHIEKSEFISLCPTDTAIKGTVHLSENAIVLVRESIYNSLNEEEKELLSLSIRNLKLFNDDIKEAVEKALFESGKTPEILSLSREKKGYEPSDTSENLIATINNIASEYNISQELFFNILTGQTDDNEKLVSVNNEFENYNKVYRYYQNKFLEYLFNKINIDSNLQYNLLNYGNKHYLKLLFDRIEEIGMDNYRQVVTEFNSMIEKLKNEEQLLTPQEIISFLNDGMELNSEITSFER